MNNLPSQSEKTNAERKTLLQIKKFLKENANSIQKIATQHHKELLGDANYRSEYISKYQKNHIRVIDEFVKNLEIADIKKSSKEFKMLGEILAKDSVKDDLT